MKKLMISLLLNFFFIFSSYGNDADICLNAALVGYVSETENTSILDYSSWWDSIKEKVYGYQARNGNSETTSALQGRYSNVDRSKLSPEDLAEIDRRIESMSTSLADQRNYMEIVEEFSYNVANGVIMPIPIDPAKLRVWRRDAWSFAETTVKSRAARGENPIDENFIQELYGRMMTGKPGKAKYREYQPGTGGETTDGGRAIFQYMPADHVGPAMKKFQQDLAEKVAKGEDAIDTAVWIERTLVSIHPFDDGNGRIAREVASAFLSSQGIPRPLLNTGEEYRFLVMPNANFPVTDHQTLRGVYEEGISRHLDILEP